MEGSLDADGWLEQQLRRLQNYTQDRDPIMKQKKQAERLLLEV